MLSTVVSTYRTFLLGSLPPSATGLVALTALSVALLAAGAFAFRRMAGGFSDEL